MLRFKDFSVGDLVYIKRKPFTPYKWHFKYPKTRFIGLVLDKIDGGSYSTVYMQIVYPNKGKDLWSCNNRSQRKTNYWDYDIFDLDTKVDLNKLNDYMYNELVSRLL